MERIHEEAIGMSDPFHAPRVIIPHRQAGVYLRHVYTKRHGVAMNLRFDYLEEALWEFYFQFAGREGVLRRLTRERAQIAILHLLGSDLRSNACPAPLARYFPGGMESTPAASLKLWELAGRLAFLFLEYTVQRPDLIARWDRGDVNTTEMAQWQAGLYRRSIGPGSPLQQDGFEYRFLPDFPEVPNESGLTGKMTLYAPGPLSQLHFDALRRISGHLQIDILALDSGNISDTSPIARHLATWQVPLKVSQSLASAVEKQETNIAPHDSPNQTSRMRAIQGFLAGGKPPVDLPESDPSIELGGAAGVLREVQAVHQSILHRMLKDETLLQTDIAIITPGGSEYTSAVNAVFTDGSSPMGFNMVRANTLHESLYAQGVVALFDLLTGDFSRQDAFSLFQNPCFQKAAGCSASEVNDWLAEIDRARIHRYLDSDHVASTGEPAAGTFTWWQGLERMRLGHIMDLTPEEEDQFGIHPISRESQTSTGCVSQLSVVFEKLKNAKSVIGDTERTLADWSRLFSDILDQFLAVPDDHPGEESILSSLQRTLARMGTQEDGACHVYHSHLFQNLVRGSLGSLSIRRGIPLYRGVTVGTMETLRAIPFRVIYILGLNTGHFPRQAAPSSIDLRVADPGPLDISITDRDRHLFLETLMAAGDAVVLTYQSRDLKRDQELFPSSVILQLQDMVEAATGSPLKAHVIPWHGHSRAIFNLGEQQTSLTSNYDHLDRAILNASIGMKDHERESATPIVHTPDDQPTLVNLRTLSGFLEDPLSDFLASQLQIRGYDDDKHEILNESEPFEFSILDESLLLRRILMEFLDANERTRPAPHTLIDTHIGRAVGKSELADGNFRTRFRARILDIIEHQTSWLATWQEGMRGTHAQILKPFAFGSSRSRPKGSGIFPDIVYHHAGLQQEFLIQGELPLLAIPHDPGSTMESLIIKPASGLKKSLHAGYFPAILSYIFLLAAREENEWIQSTFPATFHSRIWCLYKPNEKGALAHPLAISLTPERARSLADNILAEFAENRQPYLLPFALIGKTDYIPDQGTCDEELTPKDIQEMVDEDQSAPFPKWYPDDWSLAMSAEPPENPTEVLGRRLAFIHDVGGIG